MLTVDKQRITDNNILSERGMFNSWIGIAAIFIIGVILALTQRKRISETAGKHFSPVRFLIIFAILLVILALLRKQLPIDDSKSVILYLIPWIIIVPIAVFAYIKRDQAPGMKKLQLTKLILFLVGISCIIVRLVIPPTVLSLTMSLLLTSITFIAFLTFLVLSFIK